MALYNEASERVQTVIRISFEYNSNQVLSLSRRKHTISVFISSRYVMEIYYYYFLWVTILYLEFC